MKKYSIEMVENASSSYEMFEEGLQEEGFVLPKGFDYFEVEAETLEGAIDKALFKLAEVSDNPDEFKILKRYADEANIRFKNCEDSMLLDFEVIELW